jgi:hypothetical protein
VTGPAGPEPVPCEVCGHPLRTAESRRRRRGPVCDEKVNPERGGDHSPLRLRVPPAAGRRAARRAATDPAEPTLLDELDQGS